MADAEREDGNVAGARRLRVDRAQQPADADQGKWLQSGFGVMSTVVKEFSPFGLRPPGAIECSHLISRLSIVIVECHWRLS